jgi:hypothetical protein
MDTLRPVHAEGILARIRESTPQTAPLRLY